MPLKHILLKIIFFIVTVHMLLSIAYVSAGITETSKDNPISAYIFLSKWQRKSSEKSLSTLPNNIINYILSFYCDSLFELPGFLNWTFSTIPPPLKNSEKYTSYSCENYKNIHDSYALYEKSPEKRQWQLMLTATEEKLSADQIALRSNIDLADIHPQRLNDCIDYGKKKSFFKDRKDFFNRILPTEPQLPAAIFLDEFYSIIKSISFSRNDHPNHSLFISALNDRKNTVAILPILKNNLIIILRKSEIILAQYKWQDTNYSRQYIISELFSQQITIPPDIPKEILSYGISNERENIKIIIYKKNNKSEKEFVALIQGSIPEITLDNKNLKSKLLPFVAQKKPDKLLIFKVFYKYISHTLNKPFSTDKMELIKNREKKFETKSNISIKRFLITYENNTKNFSRGTKIIEAHTEHLNKLKKKALIKKCAWSALIFLTLFGINTLLNYLIKKKFIIDQ